jgi:transposase-like protein
MAKKGQKFKQWTAKEKYKIIEPLLNFEATYGQISKKNGINKGMLSVWVKKYKENGIIGLESIKKPGNPLSKIFNKKIFKNREEELEYENMKLRIENERLKKGYLVKGDGSVVVFKK